MIDDRLIDEVMKRAEESPRKRMNYNLHESLESPCQRLINVVLPGTKLEIHRHRHTAETYMCLRGRFDIVYYDDNGEITERIELDPLNGRYGVNIPAGQWHTIDVHEPSAAFSVKEGPYRPLAPEDALIV